MKCEFYALYIHKRRKIHGLGEMINYFPIISDWIHLGRQTCVESRHKYRRHCVGWIVYTSVFGKPSDADFLSEKIETM